MWGEREGLTCGKGPGLDLNPGCHSGAPVHMSRASLVSHRATQVRENVNLSRFFLLVFFLQ